MERRMRLAIARRGQRKERAILELTSWPSFIPKSLFAVEAMNVRSDWTFALSAWSGEAGTPSTSRRGSGKNPRSALRNPTCRVAMTHSGLNAWIGGQGTWNSS